MDRNPSAVVGYARYTAARFYRKPKAVAVIRITIGVFLRATRRFWPAGNPRFPAENSPPVLHPPKVAGATELLRIRADRGLYILVAAQFTRPWRGALGHLRNLWISVVLRVPPRPLRLNRRHLDHNPLESSHRAQILWRNAGGSVCFVTEIRVICGCFGCRRSLVATATRAGFSVARW